jgi:hypothetical protein
MILMTQSELLELVEELRGMAAVASTANVRDALTRMADRYAARAAATSRLGPVADALTRMSATSSATSPACRSISASNEVMITPTWNRGYVAALQRRL